MLGLGVLSPKIRSIVLLSERKTPAIRTRSQEVKMELVGKAFRGGERGDREFGQVSIHVFGLVGAVGSCLGGSVLVGRLAGVVAFG